MRTLWRKNMRSWNNLWWWQRWDVLVLNRRSDVRLPPSRVVMILFLVLLQVAMMFVCFCIWFCLSLFLFVLLLPWRIVRARLELQNLKLFTQIKSFKPNFTPRKACKFWQILHSLLGKWCFGQIFPIVKNTIFSDLHYLRWT